MIEVKKFKAPVSVGESLQCDGNVCPLSLEFEYGDNSLDKTDSGWMITASGLTYCPSCKGNILFENAQVVQEMCGEIEEEESDD